MQNWQVHCLWLPCGLICAWIETWSCQSNNKQHIRTKLVWLRYAHHRFVMALVQYRMVQVIRRKLARLRPPRLPPCHTQGCKVPANTASNHLLWWNNPRTICRNEPGVEAQSPSITYIGKVKTDLQTIPAKKPQVLPKKNASRVR